MATNPAGMGTGLSAGMTTGGACTSEAGTVARKGAEFLHRTRQVAVQELGGWDSHFNQAVPVGALSNNLCTLDALLAARRGGLQAGGTWQNNVVIVATEFRREVAVNGTQGTDHGAASAPSCWVARCAAPLAAVSLPTGPAWRPASAAKAATCASPPNYAVRCAPCCTSTWA